MHIFALELLIAVTGFGVTMPTAKLHLISKLANSI